MLIPCGFASLNISMFTALPVSRPSPKGVREEQMIVSQSLRKLRDANLVQTERRGLFIFYKICEEYPASLFTCLRKLYGYMTDSFHYLRDDCKAVLPADYTMLARPIR